MIQLFLSSSFMSQLSWGGTVPESYYLMNQTTSKKEDMNKVTIGRGSVHCLEVEVTRTGSSIR